MTTSIEAARIILTNRLQEYRAGQRHADLITAYAAGYGLSEDSAPEALIVDDALRTTTERDAAFLGLQARTIEDAIVQLDAL